MLGFLASSISKVYCFLVNSDFSCFILFCFFLSCFGFESKKLGYRSKTFSFKLSFVLHFFFSIDIVWYIAFGFLYPVISDNLFFAILGFLASSISRVFCFLVNSVFPVLGVVLKKSGYNSRTFAFTSSFVSHLFFSLVNAIRMLLGFLYSVSFTSSFPVMLGFLASSFSSVSCFLVSSVFPVFGVVLKKYVILKLLLLLLRLFCISFLVRLMRFSYFPGFYNQLVLPVLFLLY